MSNHVHLVLVPRRAASLGLALKHAHGRYASYWNAIHHSSGHVWQGRYYSCPLDEPHLWEALRYTELNPVRAGLVVYTLYWINRTDRDDSSINANSGQSLLIELSQATGGYSYWTGTGNPVSFDSFFEDLNRRLVSQYALEFTSRLDRKPEVEQLKLKIDGLGLTVTAPQSVYVDHAGSK